MKLSKRASITLTLAQEAGNLLLAEASIIHKSKKASSHISHKKNIGTGEQEIVTTVDRLIDTLIIKTIQTNFPGEFILTEESYKKTSDKKRLRQKNLWIIDPIDGSADFSHFLLGRKLQKGQRSFSISIAWVKNKQVQLGVVHTPLLSETWVAEQNHGAWYKKDKTAWKKIRMHPIKSRLLTVALNGHERATGENTHRLNNHRLVYHGSLVYRIVGTAVGHHDALISFNGGSKEWDVAAADIIVQEAGGRLLDGHNRPLCYNKADLVNHTLLIAGHSKTINTLLKTINTKKNFSQ